MIHRQPKSCWVPMLERWECINLNYNSYRDDGSFFFPHIWINRSRKMEDNQRSRPLLDKPIYRGCPISWAREYFRSSFSEFRRKNPSFDEFLVGLNEKLKFEEGKQYGNIIKLIDGQGEANWISPRKSIFTALIRLYNLCFSSEQALTYIHRCYRLYQFMFNSDYCLDNHYELSVKRSRWDGKARKFIDVSLNLVCRPIESDFDFWFDISLSSIAVTGHTTYMPDVEIKAMNSKEIFEDTLMLFVYHQEEDKLFNKLYDVAITELTKKKILVKKDIQPSRSDATEYLIKGVIGKN